MREINVLNKKYNGISLDVKISALGNKTLRQVFENGNLITNWTSNVSTGTISYEDDWLVHTLTNSQSFNGIVFAGTTPVSNSKLYISVETIFPTNDANYRLFIFGIVNQFVAYTVRSGVPETRSLIYQGAYTSNQFVFYDRNGATQTNGMKTKRRNMFILNLDSLGIDLTRGEMDFYRDMYLFLKKDQMKSTRFYSPEGKTPFDIAYVNQTIDDPIFGLNNLTLRQVFEAGNNHTGFGTKGVGTITHYDGYSTFMPTNLWSGLRGSTESIKPGTNYIRFDYKSDGIGMASYLIGVPGNVGLLTFGIQDWATYSGIYEASSIVSGQGYFTIETLDTNYELLYGRNAYCISLAQLGLSHLTKTEMDFYYDLYKRRKTVPKKHITYYDIFTRYNVIRNAVYVSWANATDLFRQEEYLEYKRADLTANAAHLGFTVSGSLKEYYSRIRASYHNFLGTIGFTSSGGTLISSIMNTQDVIVDISEIRTVSFTWVAITSLAASGANNVPIQVRFYTDDALVIPLDLFDENISKSVLDKISSDYSTLRKKIVYPKLYLSTEPTGFGNRYVFNELNKKTYGHELNFENITINLLFGLYWNAYDGFNQLMKFISNNEAIIEYNYGKGERYTDVRLINAPKTEMEQGNILRSKFDFKRLTPFYTILEGASLVVTNDHDWDLKMIVEGTVNTNTVFIEAENLESGPNQVVKFNFTSVTKPFNFYYNSETKQILINGVNNGYQYIDQSAGISFISVPKGEQHSLFTTGITNPKIKVKKWVID